MSLENGGENDVASAALASASASAAATTNNTNSNDEEVGGMDAQGEGEGENEQASLLLPSISSADDTRPPRRVGVGVGVGKQVVQLLKARLDPATTATDEEDQDVDLLYYQRQESSPLNDDDDDDNHHHHHDGGGGGATDRRSSRHRRPQKHPYRRRRQRQQEVDDDEGNCGARDDDHGRAQEEEEEDGYVRDGDVDEIVLSGVGASFGSYWFDVLDANWVPDDACCRLGGVRIADGPMVVKLGKFWLLTWAMILTIFYSVRYLELENKTTITLGEMILYQGNDITVDIMTFFMIGRLWHARDGRSIDRCTWMGTCLAANLYYMYGNTFKFMQHSFTLYEMHCRWPLQLWIFVAVLIPIIITITLLHVREAVERGIFVSKFLELIVTVGVFLMPPLLFSRYFHFHHWFAGWLVGMHCNFGNRTWSALAQAWFWGVYINGIATYGRDPILTCGYAMWLSKDALHCPFLECYLWAIQHTNETDEDDHAHEMIPPDWRNCSSDSYHP